MHCWLLLGYPVACVFRYSGILSAYGLALADVVHEAQEPSAQKYQGQLYQLQRLLLCTHLLSLSSPESSFEYLDKRIDALTEECVAELMKQGFRQGDITTTPYLNLRYDRTDCALMVAIDDQYKKSTEGVALCRHGDFRSAFTARYNNDCHFFAMFFCSCRYMQEFGFTISDRSIIVDDIRVRGVAKACSHSPAAVPTGLPQASPDTVNHSL